MSELVRPSRPRPGGLTTLRYVGSWLILGTISLFALSGCAATPPTPTLPPSPDQVGVSAALEAFALAKVAAYAQSVGVPSFDLAVWSAEEATQAVADGRLQLLVSAAPPPSGWFATPLGFEAIAIIANPEMRIRDLSLGQLRDVFTGTIRTWDEIDGPKEPIQLVIPPQGDELRRQFEDLVMSEQQFPRTALLAPTPAAMATLVVQTSGAIGILPLSASAEGARVISINSEAPSSQDSATPDYALRFEVIATAPGEPQGGVRAWLAWLQEQQ
jgi:hypothetical protein